MRSSRSVRWFTLIPMLVLVLSNSLTPAAAQGIKPPAEDFAPPADGIVISEPVEAVLTKPLTELAQSGIQSPVPGTEKEIPNFSRAEALGVTPEKESTPDPALRYPEAPQAMPGFTANFAGVGNIFGVLPPDTNGDIGYDPATGKKYYVQWVNLAVQMWDVTNPAAPVSVLGPWAGNQLWSGTGGACDIHNNGDPIVLFDSIANRWILTQFAMPNYPAGPFYECIAVSQTANPSGAYYLYDFLVHATKLNDYPKLGVWPDGYYMTANQFTPVGSSYTWGGVGVWSFNRAQMLAGQAANFIYFDLASVDSNLFGILPADLDGINLPPAGAPIPMLAYVDSSWGYPADGLSQWAFHADWNTPANSTFTYSGTINVDPLDPQLCTADRGKCIPQPGTAVQLEDLTERLMWRLQYRNNGAYQAMTTNITVDTGGGIAGIRWFELQKTTGNWELTQEGTFAGSSVNSDHRWMGSVAMDGSGNLALGYSVSSASVYPSIRVAGRLANDPPGVLVQSEAEMMTGGGAQTYSGGRWGDYSSMSVDPQDNCTFWYTQEYLLVTSSSAWVTRIGAFKFPTCITPDSGILKGKVTSAAGGSAIVGAKIVVDVSGTPWETVTDGSGNYSLILPTGTFTAEASSYGFVTGSESVTIVKNGQTTADFSLSAMPLVTVQGTVRDGIPGGHAFPLYARVEFAGTGLAPVYTNPLTGTYTINVAQGTPIVGTATALDPGYKPASLPVNPVNPTNTLDFNLLLNLESSTCPSGYAFSGISETFSSLSLPAGWANVDLAGSAATWEFNDPGNRQNITGGDGGFAIFDSDHWGRRATSSDAALITPSLDLSGFNQLFVSFKSDFKWYSGTPAEVIRVEAAFDGSSSWTEIWSHSGSDARGPQIISVDLTALMAGHSTMQVRFRDSNTNYDWWWEIDDVRVGNTCQPIEGALLVGVIRDVNTGNTLNGVRISTPLAEGFSGGNLGGTPLPGGYYRFFSGQIGSTTLTADGPYGYAGDSVVVNAVNNGIYTRDFNLKAPQVSIVQPGVLQATVAQNGTITLPLTLRNNGNVPVELQLFKVKTAYTAPVNGNLAAPHRHFSPKRLNESTAALSYNLELPDAPAVPGAGDPIDFWSSGLSRPWGIGRNNEDTAIWLGNLVSEDVPVINYEFSKAGISTGNTIDTTGWTTGWSADMAPNPFAGTMWQVKVAGDGCIYEMDLVSKTNTGRKVCPAFGTTQRGLAYNPLDDTFYSGSWNDGIIHQFDTTGHIFRSIDTGINVGGLAFNPETRHLFVLANQVVTSPFVYVLDTTNNLALIGSFSAAGFADNNQAGLEMDCSGALWAPNLASGMVFFFTSGESNACTWNQVPWLSPALPGLAVPAAAERTIDVTFDAAGLAPGTYLAHLHVFGVTPYQDVYVPVEMTVTPGQVFVPLIQR